jgi:hypothetical protein
MAFYFIITQANPQTLSSSPRANLRGVCNMVRVFITDIQENWAAPSYVTSHNSLGTTTVSFPRQQYNRHPFLSFLCFAFILDEEMSFSY